jgi:hypothetical protein
MLRLRPPYREGATWNIHSVVAHTRSCCESSPINSTWPSPDSPRLSPTTVTTDEQSVSQLPIDIEYRTGCVDTGGPIPLDDDDDDEGS